MRAAYIIWSFSLFLLSSWAFMEGLRKWEGLAGSGFFPIILAFIFLLLGFLFLFLKPNSDEEKFPWPDKIARERIILILLLFFGYVFISPQIGYGISTTIFIAGIMRILGEPRWHFNIIFGAIIAIFTFIVFKNWLNLPLPSGVLGF